MKNILLMSFILVSSTIPRILSKEFGWVFFPKLKLEEYGDAKRQREREFA